jgi:hypothetical protein
MFQLAASAADFPGYAKVEIFDGVGGGNIANLTAAPKYTNNQPDFVTFTDSLYYSRTPGADNWGARISGLLTPTETAEYVFFVAADDSCSFYLSTDSSPTNLKLIAADQGWQNARTWTGIGGASSGAGTDAVIFRRGFNPGAAVLATNDFQWVGPLQNRSDQFLKSPLVNLAVNRWPTTDANGNYKINLTANQSYYFELLFKEGSGGENAGVTWKKAGTPDPANNDPEIPGSFLKAVNANVLNSQTVAQGQTASFRGSAVAVPGDVDFTQYAYQWRVNGQAITDGTGNAATYTIPSVALSDNGKKYSVVVTGGTTGQTATSTEATLTVTSDTAPPVIATIRSTDTFNIARVTFSEAVNNAAVTPSNYTLSGGLTVTDAKFVIVADDVNNPEDPKNPRSPANRVTVILNTSKQTDAGIYDLTVNANVKDLVGNAIVANTGKLYANTFKSGLLLYKRWNGLGHRNFQTLLADPVYDTPNSVQTRTIAEEWPGVQTDIPNQVYLAMLTGFFIPQTTGDYIFFHSVDNDGWLYLSTDEDPKNQVMVAADIGWQNNRVWTGAGGDTAKRRGDLVGGGPFENRSDEMLTSPRGIAMNWTGNRPFDEVKYWPTVDANGNAKITLTAGKRYPIFSYHSEPEGGHSEMTFKLAGEPDPVNGTVTRMTGNLIGAFIDPSSLPPLITNQPVNVDFTLGGTINLSVGVDSAAPPAYQWYRGITAIAGATNRTLTIANATLAAVGTYYVSATTVNGSVNSANVLVYTPAPAPQPRNFQQDSAGLLVMEAENFTGMNRAPDGHVWVVQSERAGFSGTGYVQPLPDSGVNIGNGLGFLTNSPRLDFTVNFSKTGTNYLWFRGGEPRGAGDGDSVHAGIDGAALTSSIQISGAPTFTTTGWNWVGNINGDTRAFVVVPTAGPHTINVWMREDAFYFDKLVITSDGAYVPSGTGPAETVTGGGTSPTIKVARGATGSLVITYTGTLQRANSLTAPISWTDVGSAASPYTIPTTTGQGFYRAR